MRFNNFHLGALLVLGGVVLFLTDGPRSSRKYQSEWSPQLMGLILFALGVWTIVRQLARRS